MKYLFKRDTLLVTVSIFILIGLILSLPFNFHFMEPIKNVLYDFDYTDLSYAQLNRVDAPFDDRVVIVNVGDADRAGIAAILSKLNAMHPKVIGVDLLFEKLKDPQQDSVLRESIKNIPDLVLANRVTDTSLTGVFNSWAAYNGYANFYGEKGSVVRYFAPLKNYKGVPVKSFSGAIMSIAYPKAYAKLRKRDKRVEMINYKRHQSKYLVINYRDLFANKVAEESIKDKIILVGFVSDNPNDIEDKHYTPMNEKFLGKSIPDTYGVVIHANIISMILDRDYVHCLHLWQNWFLAVLLGWIYIAIFMRHFIDKHIWFHLVVGLIELVSAVLFIFITIVMFNDFNVKIDMTPTLGIIIISAEVLYFYHGVAVWLYKKYNYKTIFYKPEH
jgi:CHASE2 domain-containing sensor protein